MKSHRLAKLRDAKNVIEMIDLLSVKDSLADKPSFRWTLEENEKDINDLETILDKVI